MKKFNRVSDRRAAKQNTVREALVNYSDDTPQPLLSRLRAFGAKMVPAWSAELQLNETELKNSDCLVR